MSAFGTYRCVSWQMIPRTQVIRMPQRILPLTSFGQKERGHQNTNQSQQYGDSLRGEGPFCYRGFEGKDAYQCGIISNNDLGILQSDECDKETDTYGYCVFQVHRMELKIASRTLVRESRIKMIPSAKTAASACCQVYPIPRTTV